MRMLWFAAGAATVAAIVAWRWSLTPEPDTTLMFGDDRPIRFQRNI